MFGRKGVGDFCLFFFVCWSRRGERAGAEVAREKARRA